MAKTMIFGRRCIMAAGCKAPPLLLLALALAQVSSGRGAPTLAPSPPNPECLGRYPPPSCPPPPLPPPLPTPPRQTPAQRKLIRDAIVRLGTTLYARYFDSTRGALRSATD